MRRIFITGSEWLFYKLYTGPKTADLILTEVIKPVSEELLKNGIIDSWFFIRYSDPKFHLRVRFHHTQNIQIQKSIQIVHNYLFPYVDTNLIWNVSNDTYVRELERYGYSLIERAERIFFYESVMIVGILALIDGDDGEMIRWLIGLRAIDDILEMFGFNEEQKRSYLEKLRNGFGEEFGMKKDLKLQLSNKYRIEKKKIENILNRTHDNDSEMAPIYELLQIRKQKTLPIVLEIKNLEKNNNLEVSVDQQINSYLHMMINRLFKSKQRLHELVLYDFLCQYYTSQIARKKRTTENTALS